MKMKSSKKQLIKVYYKKIHEFVLYPRWYKKNSPTSDELALQQEHKWKDNAPLFSIIIPLYKTPSKFLIELINSIKSQTYGKFEVCFSDGSPSDYNLGSLIREASKCDPRFKYKKLSENKGISENTNEALQMASGDFILLCDHDDLLAPNALFEFAIKICRDTNCDCLYSDEDKIDIHGKRLFSPHFKPDYNEDMLLSDNYICHLFGVRKDLVNLYGDFDPYYDGAQDYDFIFRMTEHARHVCHIPKVLYHWRVSPNSTASNPQSKLYAFDNGKKAIEAHCKRVYPDCLIEKIEDGPSLGIYHTVFKVQYEMTISVIISSTDNSDNLGNAINSLMNANWKSLEIIVVEHNSKQKKTWNYYKRIQKEFSNVKVIEYKGINDNSSIINFGVAHSQGKYILIMSDNVRMIEKNSLKDMIGYLQRKDTGAVGSRILYPDNTIKHGGVIIGLKGSADSAFLLEPQCKTYFNRALTTQNYSAITGDVFLTKRALYNSLGGLKKGFSEVSPYSYIDLCLRMRKQNLKIVYDSKACFSWNECKTNAKVINKNIKTKFLSDKRLFIIRWHEYIIVGDPYYNCNLTLEKNDFSIRSV